MKAKDYVQSICNLAEQYYSAETIGDIPGVVLPLKEEVLKFAYFLNDSEERDSQLEELVGSFTSVWLQFQKTDDLEGFRVFDSKMRDFISQVQDILSRS